MCTLVITGENPYSDKHAQNAAKYSEWQQSCSHSRKYPNRYATQHRIAGKDLSPRPIRLVFLDYGKREKILGGSLNHDLKSRDSEKPNGECEHFTD